MDKALNIVSQQIILALSESLPMLSSNWWEKYVVSQLTSNQQNFIKYREAKLNSLDLSASIRVFTRNFNLISDIRGLPRDCNSFAFQVLDVRNRNAHRTAEVVDEEDRYRDMDTMVRFLRLLKADSESVQMLQEAKDAALVAIARSKAPVTPEQCSRKKTADHKESMEVKIDSVVGALTKREALALLESKLGLRVRSSQVTFSNINRASGNWWFEPSGNAFSKDRLIVLNDGNKRVFYVLQIPANHFFPPEDYFYIRSDCGRSSIYVSPNDTVNFRDIHPSGPGKVSFGKYFIESIEY